VYPCFPVPPHNGCYVFRCQSRAPLRSESHDMPWAVSELELRVRESPNVLPIELYLRSMSQALTSDL
jgi:hypothetical protein